jgi:hypothetical protein
MTDPAVMRVLLRYREAVAQATVLMSSGNITSGTIDCYGIKHA